MAQGTICFVGPTALKCIAEVPGKDFVRPVGSSLDLMRVRRFCGGHCSTPHFARRCARDAPADSRHNFLISTLSLTMGNGSDKMPFRCGFGHCSNLFWISCTGRETCYASQQQDDLEVLLNGLKD